MVVMKLSLIIKVNSLMSWIFVDKPDDQYDYENAIYRIKMNKARVGDVELKEKYEKDHPVDAVESLKTVNKLIAKKNRKPLTAVEELKFVKPNRHVGEDIFSHPFSGSYEHQDENGNWVEGPALGHVYEGGYEGGYECNFDIDSFFSKFKNKLFG